MNHKFCPVCQSENFRQLRAFVEFHLVKCSNCSLVYAIRIPSDEELNKHYSTYNRGRNVSPLTINRYEELLLILDNKSGSKKILDVGCGSGFFLETASRMGWNATGTEYDDFSVNLCKSKGLYVIKGSIEDIKLEKGSYDAITSFEVIEHLSTPSSHLSTLFSLLKPGGTLYITTPNFNAVTKRLFKSNWSVISYPEHLTYFTPKTLNTTLKSVGFIKLKLVSDGISVDRFVNLISRKQINSENNSANTASSRTISLSNETVRQASQKYWLIKNLRKLADTTLNQTGSGEFLKGFYQKPNE